MKIVYSVPNCPGCIKLKNAMNENGEPYEEIMIGRDIPIDDFRKMYPHAKAAPFVVEDADDQS